MVSRMDKGRNSRELIITHKPQYGYKTTELSSHAPDPTTTIIKHDLKICGTYILRFLSLKKPES